MYEKLAALVSQVHKIQLSGYGYIGSGIAEWGKFSEFMCDSLEDNISVLKERQMINEREIKNIENEITKRLEKCDSCPPVLIHGDLSAKNVIIHEKNITLIDWDDSYALCWVADIAALTLKMKWQYGADGEIYREAFLSKYKTDYDKKLFYEVEDILHVRNGIDALSFFSGNPNYQDSVDVTKVILRESLKKCGMEVLRCL
jgi:5-methylthioribose kinase